MAEKRRGNREGSFRQRANGTWQGVVMLGYTPEGKKRLRYVSGKTRTEAQRRMRDLLRDIDDGIQIESDCTLSEWLETFMMLHAPNIKATTQENYRYTARIISRHPISKKLISTIKPMDVERFLRDLVGEGRSQSYISKVRAMLHIAMDRATGHDIIRRNPVPYAMAPRMNDEKYQPCFTEDEVVTLLRELPDDRTGNATRLMLVSGLRTQELLALDPKRHIAPDGSYVLVEQAITMVRGTAVVSTPKSKSSYRKIPIPRGIRDCVLSLRDTTASYVWTAPNSDPRKPANPTTFRNAYRKAIEATGVEYKPPHAMRRAYVSFLESRAVPLSTIQALVGHNSMRVTQSSYLTVQDSARIKAAAVFDDVFKTEE